MKGSDFNLMVVSVAIIIVGGAAIFNYLDRFSIVNPVYSGESLVKTESDNGGIRKAVVYVPAVDNNGKGSIGSFEVQLMKGDGKILTNIDHLLFFVDTQFSMQTAKSVASNVTGVDLSDHNIVYDIDPAGILESTRVVEGPSAGAALTVATIALIENKNLDKDVMITGTINEDGSIGRVGGISEKAKVAKLYGASVFLVPEGQGIVGNFKPETKCEKTGRFKVCRTDYIEVESISTDINGLIIREVSDVREALKYFLPQ